VKCIKKILFAGRLEKRFDTFGGKSGVGLAPHVWQGIWGGEGLGMQKNLQHVGVSIKLYNYSIVATAMHLTAVRKHQSYGHI